MYKPPMNQRQKLNATLLEGVAYYPRTCTMETKNILHPPILAWSAQMDEELTVMREGNKLKKHHLFATTGDETSFSVILNTLYMYSTAPNADANVVRILLFLLQGVKNILGSEMIFVLRTSIWLHGVHGSRAEKTCTRGWDTCLSNM